MRTIVITFLILLSLAISALGVDKTSSAQAKQKPLQSIPATDSLSNEKAEKTILDKSTDSKKDYNDFIDTNNNGLDDRAEGNKSKQAPPSSNIEPERKTRAPKPDSTSKIK